jgi:hypothetical protein
VNAEVAMSLGPFGKAYHESLREGNPELYEHLRASGALAGHLAEVDGAAQLEFDSTLAALLKQHPPSAFSFLERLQHVTALASQAREIVMNDLLVRDDAAESDRE